MQLTERFCSTKLVSVFEEARSEEMDREADNTMGNDEEAGEPLISGVIGVFGVVVVGGGVAGS